MAHEMPAEALLALGGKTVPTDPDAGKKEDTAATSPAVTKQGSVIEEGGEA